MHTMRTVELSAEQLDFLEVTKSHYQHSQRQQRWKFLWDSYQGGEAYKNGGYLTKYELETPEGYAARIRATPLDNHCQSIVSVYVSFLFRDAITRDVAGLGATAEEFIRDSDLDGRSLDAFMQDAAIMSGVFGHCFILMTKAAMPADGATLYDQQTLGIRPYVNLLSPLVVLDWSWKREISGRYVMDYVKYVEDVNGSVSVVKVWTLDTITTWSVDYDRKVANVVETVPNALGIIPIVILMNKKSDYRGIGISDLEDIADQQRAIYNELSEVEQAIRLEGHPSIVITSDTTLSSGAGAVIVMPDNMDAGLKPYVLDVDATPVESIYTSIEHRIEAIDKMANTGGIRAVESRVLSGVALESEFQLLAARLSEKAANLALAEEQLWKLYATYEQTAWTGSITYPTSFNLRDGLREIETLKTAADFVTPDSEAAKLIQDKLLIILQADIDK